MVWCGGLRRTQDQPQDLELLFSVLFVLYLVFGILLFFCGFVVFEVFLDYLRVFRRPRTERASECTTPM